MAKPDGKGMQDAIFTDEIGRQLRLAEFSDGSVLLMESNRRIRRPMTWIFPPEEAARMARVLGEATASKNGATDD